MAKIDPSIGEEYSKSICAGCVDKINRFHEENPKWRGRVYLTLHSRKYFKNIMLLLCDDCKQLLLVQIKKKQLNNYKGVSR